MATLWHSYSHSNHGIPDLEPPLLFGSFWRTGMVTTFL